MNIKRFLLLGIVALYAIIPAWGQAQKVEIRGSVIDDEGEPAISIVIRITMKGRCIRHHRPRRKVQDHGRSQYDPAFLGICLRIKNSKTKRKDNDKRSDLVRSIDD